MNEIFPDKAFHERFVTLIGQEAGRFTTLLEVADFIKTLSNPDYSDYERWKHEQGKDETKAT